MRTDSKPDGKAGNEPLHFKSSEPLICERWMTTGVHTVKPLDSIAHARALLKEHRINQLPVEKEGLLVGIVTDRDLRNGPSALSISTKRAGSVELRLQTPEEVPVESVMTNNVITLVPHSTVINAAVVMRRERIGSVPIVDGASIVGILTRSDVLDAFIARENGRQERA